MPDDINYDALGSANTGNEDKALTEASVLMLAAAEFSQL